MHIESQNLQYSLSELRLLHFLNVSRSLKIEQLTRINISHRSKANLIGILLGPSNNTGGCNKKQATNVISTYISIFIAGTYAQIRMSLANMQHGNMKRRMVKMFASGFCRAVQVKKRDVERAKGMLALVELTLSAISKITSDAAAWGREPKCKAYRIRRSFRWNGRETPPPRLHGEGNAIISGFPRT